MSKIEWTEQTWNPVRGCRRVSPGCVNCYAERQAIRHAGPGRPYEGLAVMHEGGPRWTGEAHFIPSKLEEPLRRKKPTTYFVNSMSDLFHEDVTDAQIVAIFLVMAKCPQHTFQVLTKRPERMLEWFGSQGRLRESVSALGGLREWPLPNVWVGVSVEDQQRADERIPLLLQTPAAVRFLSCEPLLGPVDLSPWLGPPPVSGPGSERPWEGDLDERGLDWVIVGGESGPGARPCELYWLRSIVEQCAEAGVPCFVKQLGADPRIGGYGRGAPSLNSDHPDVQAIEAMRDRKGGDPEEWPADLRVREMPRTKA